MDNSPHHWKPCKIWIILATCLVFSNGQKEPLSSVRLVTYNTGLTSRVDHYDVRKEGIWDAVTELDADVMCLQEVWFYRDLKSIVEKTSLSHTYSYSALHQNVGQLSDVSPQHSPCMSIIFLTDFVPCVLTKCAQSPDTASYVTCAKETCQMLEILEQECITCLVVSKDFQRCFDDFGNAFNVPGLVLLSRRPLRHVHLRRFVPDRKLLLPRAFISAEVEGVGLVTCTHATANLGPIYFEDLSNLYKSWSEQTLSEAQELVRYMKRSDRCTIMGDLNSSPKSPQHGIKADMSDAFTYIISQGYTSSYLESPVTCTWCTYNTLTHENKSLVLDHILTKNVNVTEAVRVIDENVSGEEFPYSDHYGVMVVVQEP